MRFLFISFVSLSWEIMFFFPVRLCGIFLRSAALFFSCFRPCAPSPGPDSWLCCCASARKTGPESAGLRLLLPTPNPPPSQPSFAEKTLPFSRSCLQQQHTTITTKQNRKTKQKTLAPYLTKFFQFHVSNAPIEQQWWATTRGEGAALVRSPCIGSEKFDIDPYYKLKFNCSTCLPFFLFRLNPCRLDTPKLPCFKWMVLYVIFHNQFSLH